MIRQRGPAGLLSVLLVLVIVAIVSAGCLGGGDDGEVEVTVNGTPLTTPTAGSTNPTATPRPTATLEPVDPPPLTSDLDPEGLEGFIVPILGACMPSRDAVLPNAPRAYRNGVHEGVDFYHGDVCAAVTLDLAIIAMYDGVVVRADLDYVDITAAQVTELAARTAEQGFSDPETLDIYRGRQVWKRLLLRQR